MDSSDFDLAWNLSPRSPTPMLSLGGGFSDFRQPEPAANWLHQSSQVAQFGLGLDLDLQMAPASLPQPKPTIIPALPNDEQLSAMLSSSRLSFENLQTDALKKVSSDEQFERLLGLCGPTPSMEFAAPRASPLSVPVPTSLSFGDHLGSHFDLQPAGELNYQPGSFTTLDDSIFDFSYIPSIEQQPPEQSLLPIKLEAPSPAPTTLMATAQPLKHNGRRSAARVAEASIRRLMDDYSTAEDPNILQSTMAAAPTGRTRGVERAKRRVYHRNIDISLTDAELAEQLLGVDPRKYTSLSVAQRNIVASARYRQKKLNRHVTLEKLHENLKNEYQNLTSELSQLQAEIASYKTAFDGHLTSDFLD